MCALLVGLPEIVVLGVDDDPGRPLRAHVETGRRAIGERHRRPLLRR